MKLATNKNMGRLDQLLRSGIGLLLIHLGFAENPVLSDGLVGTVVGLLGILNLAAAVLRFCPFYGLAGISTLREH